MRTRPPGPGPARSRRAAVSCRRGPWHPDAARGIPSRPVAKLRLERKGRGGKTVTVVDGLPRNATFLKELSRDLKRACGTGGSVFDTGVEIQGDMRERVRDVLLQKGYVVKGA